MQPEGYLDALRKECDAFAAAARAGLDAHVPTCPAWTVADLTVHLGRVHRWAAETVRTGATERIRGRDERWPVDPSQPDLVEWFEAGGRELRASLAGSDPDAPVWTFIPEGTVLFWYRRQAV